MSFLFRAIYWEWNTTWHSKTKFTNFFLDKITAFRSFSLRIRIFADDYNIILWKCFRFWFEDLNWNKYVLSKRSKWYHNRNANRLFNKFSGLNCHRDFFFCECNSIELYYLLEKCHGIYLKQIIGHFLCLSACWK